jgi:plasmid stabilization system protein ParE
MKYTVVWIPEADAQLATIWMDSQDRESVRVAAAEIERLLRTNPSEVGESRLKGQRVHFVNPLGVRFMVLEDDRIVQVLRVWTVGRRPRIV